MCHTDSSHLNMNLYMRELYYHQQFLRRHTRVGSARFAYTIPRIINLAWGSKGALPTSASQREADYNIITNCRQKLRRIREDESCGLIHDS